MLSKSKFVDEWSSRADMFLVVVVALGATVDVVQINKDCCRAHRLLVEFGIGIVINPPRSNLL